MQHEQITSFSDLPFELSEIIILLAACTHSESSKATLASLARTSRAIRSLVQPILTETVVIDDANASRVRSAAQSSRTFDATRRLLVAHPLAFSALSDVIHSAPAFSRINALAAPSRATWILLDVAPNITTLVVTSPSVPSALLTPSRARALPALTHLRASLEPRMTVSGPPETWPHALTHVVLELAMGWGDESNGRATRFLNQRIRDILALPSLLCLVLRLPRWAAATRYDLNVLAGQLRDPRLWHDIAADMDSDAPLTNISLLDHSNWLVGDQLYNE